MPSTECTMAQLPLGMNYIITSPLALRLENGTIQCAEEGDHKGCFQH